MDHSPCPFCKGKEFSIKSGYQLQCVTCGAEGPQGNLPIVARVVWESRPIEEALIAENKRLLDTQKVLLSTVGVMWSNLTLDTKHLINELREGATHADAG